MKRVAGDISFRRARAGGSVRAGLPISVPFRWYGRRKELLFLVHGFNVTQCEACETYQSFIDKMPDWMSMPGRSFWPGDTKWGKLRILAYPRKPAEAVKVGRRMAAEIYAATRGGASIKVSFIAHSLGCRVVLEALKLLQRAMPQNLRIDLVCLMAPAVPRAYVVKGGRFAKACTLPQDIIVLYSSADQALGIAFWLGQVGAWEKRFEAIGRLRPPASMTIHAYRYDLARHEDYWPSFFPLDIIAAVKNRAPPRRPISMHVNARDLVVQGRHVIRRAIPQRVIMQPRSVMSLCARC